MKNLRTAKRRAALSIAVGDMSGLWSLDRVTGALSATAKAALDAAIDFLLRDMAKRDLLTLGGSRRPNGRIRLCGLGDGETLARTNSITPAISI